MCTFRVLDWVFNDATNAGWWTVDFSALCIGTGAEVRRDR